MIEKIVDWEKLGFRCIGAVNTGIDALNCIKEKIPDLVISDIRMPGLDGIQIIKEVAEAGLNVKFIMISGFRQFEYAQGAMKYGVKYYLLKPLDKDELEKAVQKVNEEISSERRTSIISGKYTEIRSKVKEHFLISNFFAGNKKKESDSGNLYRINQKYETQFTEGVFQGVFIKIDTTDPEQIDISFILTQVMDYIDNFGNHCDEYIKTEMSSGLILLINYREEREQEIVNAIEVLYNDVLDYIKRFKGVMLTIGVGVKENNISRTWNCLETAIDAIKYRLRFTNVRIIYFSEYKFEYRKLEDILGIQHFQNLKSKIEAGNLEEILYMIDDDIGRIRIVDSNYSPLMIYDLCIRYYEELKNYIDNIKILEDTIEMCLHNWKVITENDRTELKLIIDTKKLFRELIPLVQSVLKQKTVRPVREAKEYIDHHFREEISLNKVADIVELNPAYLSSMFKKEFGISFSDYIMKCRIEEAKEHLSTTKEKIAAIAVSVGYHDSKYFSKLFLKEVGLKPTEYRKLYS